jgi:hypothetical protein
MSNTNIKELKISVEQDRVVTTLNIIKTLNIIFSVLVRTLQLRSLAIFERECGEWMNVPIHLDPFFTSVWTRRLRVRCELNFYLCSLRLGMHVSL